MELKVCQSLFTEGIDPQVNPLRFHQAGRMLNPSSTLSPADRLLIYRHSIAGAQQRVLEIVYPVCLQILGDSCFAGLARDYAWSPDSNCADLNEYGAAFADMLEEKLRHYPLLNELPYLPDLARLEWAWHQSLFRADDPMFDPSTLPNLVAQGTEQLQPLLSHSLYLLTSPWPVDAIWQAHKQGQQKHTFSMPDEIQYFVIYRDDGVLLEQVSSEQFLFLQLSQKGLALCEIADRLGDHAETAFRQLPVLIKRGWIRGFRPTGQES